MFQRLTKAFCVIRSVVFLFFFNDTATTEIYTLSLHDALPIFTTHGTPTSAASGRSAATSARSSSSRSEEHTSELQSPCNLVCRLLLEKKKYPVSLRKFRERLPYVVYVVNALPRQHVCSLYVSY